MKFLKSKGNLSSVSENFCPCNCSAVHDWVISQRISFHLVSREKPWFWKEKVKQDDFSSASDLKIHSNGHYIERRFYKCIRQLLGNTGHTGKISKRVKSVHWALSWLNSRIPGMAGALQLGGSFGCCDLWLTETVQVQDQEKFWGWVSCISPKIATDPESSALWQLQEKFMLNCSVGKCKPLSDWWRK